MHLSKDPTEAYQHQIPLTPERQGFRTGGPSATGSRVLAQVHIASSRPEILAARILL